MTEEVLNQDQVEQQTPQQEEPPKKLSVVEFASKIKAKYPEYKDIDDNELTSKMLSKFPTYKDQVDFTEKKNIGQTSKVGGQEPKQGGVPPTPSQSQSKSQEVKPKPSWETSALNPVAAVTKAVEEKKNQPVPKQKDWRETVFDKSVFNKPSDATYVSKPVTGEKIEQVEKSRQNMSYAIDNTTVRALKNKGLTVPVNSPVYIKQRKKIEEAVKNGDAAYTVDPNTNEPALSQTTGFLESLKNSFNKAFNDEDESEVFVNKMTTEQRVEYANKKREEAYALTKEGYVGEKPSEFTGQAGEIIGGAVPFVSKMVTAGVASAGLIAAAPETFGGSLVGLPAVLGFAFTTPAMMHQGGRDEVLRRFSILKDKNPEVSDIDLMREAENGLYTGEIVGGLTNLAFTAIGAKPVAAEAMPVIQKSIANVLKNTAKGTAKSAAELGTISAIGEAGKEVAAGIEDERYKLSAGEIINDAASSFASGATAGALLHTATQVVVGGLKMPGQLYSSIKYGLSKENPIELQAILSNNEKLGNVPEGTTEAVMADINSYNKSLEKTSEDLTPETQASVAGLIQKRENLMMEMSSKDSTQIDPYLKQIEAVNEQIKKITETNDPFAYEINDVTGQPLNGKIEEVPEQKTIEVETPEQKEINTSQSIVDKINNNEPLNVDEVENARTALYNLADTKPEVLNLIEPLIQKIENYENLTKTETIKTTEREPIEGTVAAKQRITIKPALEQSEGSTARVNLADGTTGEGTLRVKDGNYVIEVEGKEPIIVGEKAITDRDLRVTEGESPVELDENGNVKSATFETKDGHKVTITDPEKALDLGIQLSLETVGEIPDVAFDRIYEDVIKEDKIEMPIEKPKKAEVEIPEQTEIEKLRTKEQKELDSKIPNAEQYRVDGKVDRAKLTNKEDIKAFDEIYDKYDKLISPLLKKEESKVEVPKTQKKQAKGKAAKFVEEHIGEDEGEGEPKKEAEKSGEEVLKGLESKGTKASDEKSLSELAGKHKGDKLKTKIIEQARKAVKTLKSIFPNMDIHLHDNEQDFNDVMEKVGGKRTSSGNFSQLLNPDGSYSGLRIDINLNKANGRTIAHEVTHAVLSKAFGENKTLFKSFRDKISKVLSAEMNERISSFSDTEHYASKGDTHEEYIAELTGSLADNAAKLKPSTLERIASIINEFMSKLTGGKFIPFEDVKNTKDVVDFLNNVSKAIREGQDLSNITKDYAGELFEQQNLNATGKLEKELPSTGRKPKSKSALKEGVDMEDHSIIDKNTMKGKRYSVTMSDHTKVGQYENSKTGVKVPGLMGGVFYPYIKGIKDAGLGWASVTIKAAREMIQNAVDQDATLVYRMSRATGSRGNHNFKEVAYAELIKPVTDKKVTEKEFLSELNAKLNSISGGKQLVTGEYFLNKYGTETSEKIEIAKLDKNGNKIDAFDKQGKKTGFKTIKVPKKEITSLEQFKSALDKESFNKRGSLWSTIMKDSWSKKSTGNWYKFLEKNSVASLEDIANNLAETEVDNAADHDIVAAIKIAPPEYITDKKGNKIIKIYTTRDNLVNEEKGIFYVDAPDHASYPYVVKGEPIGIFDEFNHISDYFPNINNHPEFEKLINNVYKAVETKGKDLVRTLKPEEVSLTETGRKPQQIKSKEQLPQQDKVEQLRAQEQAEYDAMPNPKDKAKRQEIYDKYDKLITPLLKEGVGEVEAKVLTMDDFDTFRDAVKYNVKRTADIALDESKADYGDNKNIDELKEDLNDAGIVIEKVDSSEMMDGNYASYDGDKIKVTDENIPLQVLLHEIGEKVISDLDKSKIKIEHSNNIFEAVTTYGASRGNDAFADNFYLYFLSPETLKDLSPNVYNELNRLIPNNIKKLGKKLLDTYGTSEQILKYNKPKLTGEILSKEQSSLNKERAKTAENKGEKAINEQKELIKERQAELPKQEQKGIGEEGTTIVNKSQMPIDKKVSDMKDILREYVDEGKSLDEIKEIMKDEFGDYYNSVEGVIEQAHQEMTTTAIKNAVTERERAERGLSEVEVEAKRSFGKVFDDAKNMVANGEANGLTLAAEIVKNPRPLKAEESAVLLIDRMRISNEYNRKNAELLKAQENGETDKADIIQSQLEVLEEEMELNDEAARKSGYEQGLGLAARIMLIAQDYSLVTQMSRLKAANGGKEVPKQYQEQLKDLIAKLEEANAKLDKLEKNQAGTEKQKQLSKVKPVSRTPEQAAKEKANIKTKILSKWGQTLARMKSVVKSSSQIISKASITPEKKAQLESIVKDVNDMVKLYAELGETNLKTIINKIHQDLVGDIPDLNKSDIEDVVLGIYDVEKVKTPLTKEKIEAQANLRKVKTQIDLLKEELKNKQRSVAEKGVDYIHGWHRFAILSGAPSAAKIGTAALTRGVVTRGENIIGKALSLIPGIRQIAKKAPRQGGLSSSAEAKAFTTWFDKMTMDDVRETMKTGMSSIDYLYGRKEPMGGKVPEWMEFFGRMHSAIKLLPKRAEFFRSLEMRTEHALKNGKDVNDPMVQQEMASAAYNDAIRAIFMQDNPISSSYTKLVNGLEKDYPAFASTMKFVFPIVKVPVNYVSEQVSYLPPIAAVKMITTLYKGRKGMSGEQADYFMRALKKGAIGTAFIFMGYMNPQALGGYYTGKRKEDELEAGDIELFGTKLPHFMTHTPLLEMLQVGATMRRASDAKLAKGEEPTKFDGIPAIFKGEMTQVPFIGTGQRVMKLADNKTTDGFKDYVYSMGQSILEPQLMQNIADWTDKKEGETVKRKSEGFIDKLKEGTPGLRKTLKEEDNLKLSKKDQEEYSNIIDKGINIPELNRRTSYRVKNDEQHPDSHMTEDEFTKFIPLQKGFAKESYKVYYSEHKGLFDKLQKMIDAVPNTPKEKSEFNKLKDKIQNKIEDIHNRAIEKAKRKLNLK